MKFSGAVLAGGHSRRFGQDKARYVFEGVPLAARVLASLQGADERFIVASRSYPEFGVPVYEDLIAQQSPLSGVHTALSRAQNQWVAIAACDLPKLSADYWTALSRFCDTNEAVAVMREGHLEPLAAFYRKSLSVRAGVQLQRGDLALRALLESVDTHVVEWTALGLPDITLLNANRLEDVNR